MTTIDNDKKIVNVSTLERMARALDTRHETDVALLASMINNIDELKAEQTELERVEAMLGGKSLRYVTQEEYDALSNEEKLDNSIAWCIESDSEEDNKLIYKIGEIASSDFIEYEVDSEFLETYRFITEEEREQWNNKVEKEEVIEMLPCNDTREFVSLEFTFDGNVGNNEEIYLLNTANDVKSFVKISDLDSINQMLDARGTLIEQWDVSSGSLTSSTVVFNELTKVEDNLFTVSSEDANGKTYYMFIALDNVTANIDSVELTFTKGLWAFKRVFSYYTVYVKSINLDIITEGELKVIDSKFLTEKPGLAVENFGEIFNDLNYNVASGTYSHAEGSGTTASGTYSHAEGSATVASKGCAHAEGSATKATGVYSHAEGMGGTASGLASHSEGSNTRATGSYSHTEGHETVANGESSHAEGRSTIASGIAQHVQGKFNIEDTESKYAYITGNGEGVNKRSNAYTLDWDGNAWFAGKVTAEGEPVNDNDLVNKGYVDNSFNMAREYADNLLQDDNLNTEDKTIVGAINELEEEMFNAKADIIALDVYKADKLYYEDFVAYKTYTEENISYSSFLMDSYLYVVTLDSRIISDFTKTDYKITIILKDGRRYSGKCKFNIVTVDDTNKIGQGNFYYLDNDCMVSDAYDGLEITSSGGENLANKALLFLNNDLTDQIAEVQVAALDMVEVNSELLSNYKLTTQEEKDIWNNKVNEDKIVTCQVSNNALNLTTAKRQKAELNDGTIINLPVVSDFTEIHLYFSTLSDLTLIFPAGKYQKTPEIKANKTYEFIFTYIGEWLIGYVEYGN